ncbi:MAG: MCP four helix bundle domain-containing protein [Sneathiella sp.]|nr:MCP four helix bundle domain-containing protein [Sneathiella sp.]
MNLRNLNISTKLFISPIIFVVALIVLGIVAITGLQEEHDAMAALDKQANLKTGAALKFQVNLQAYNGNLFRLISELGAGIDEKALAEQRTGLVAYMVGAQKSLDDFIAGGQYNESELELLNKLKIQLLDYGSTSADVIEMTEVDGSTAVVMMVGASDEFNAMYATIDEIVKLWQDDGKAAFESAIADGESTITQFIVISIVSLLIAGAVTLIMSRMIKGPIQSLTNVMGKLAEGDRSVDIEAQDQKDEIGAMARAVQVFKENSVEQDRLQADAAQHAEEEAQREQKAREAEERSAEEKRQREQAENLEKQQRAEKISNLIQTFETQVSEVLSTFAGATRELQSTANSMTVTAGDSRELAEGVASASGDASRNVQTVAAAAEELTSSINEISRQVQQANQVSEKAVEEAANSTNSVSALAETAKKISDVVNMISDIAGQTNLLALNATIEAARAGDAGKGFAVVASEVKSLANQTAKATEEIAAQINDMQEATESAVSAISNIDSVISKIRESTVGISSAIEEQSAATNEISRNVQEASKGTNEVSEKIGSVSDKASETGSAAQEVQTASTHLDELSKSLQQDIESFLKDVRAA